MSLHAFDRTRKAPSLPLWLLFPLFFAFVDLTHWTLLRLPYFWDEAGYYIPAALDFFRSGSLIPYSTLSNAHPPLPSILLAEWWKLTRFTVTDTRVFVCMVAAFGLLGLFRLVRLVADDLTAAVTTLLTAIYPVWFVQSTLAHADIFAAAFTLWGLSFYLPHLADPAYPARQHRRDLFFATLLFTFAALAKETAIVTPFALGVWEAVQYLRPGHRNAHWRWFLALCFPILPLVGWYAYHHHKTGFTFGNPEFFRYNATANFEPSRIGLALWHRLLHLTAHMNLYVPVACTLAALLMPLTSKRPRLAWPVALALGLILVTNWIEFSILGGALLTRYLLPAYPILLLFCVATWRRHVALWPLLAGFTAAAFLAALWINPPYAFAPEDNLTYRDMILLHQHAISLIDHQYPQATVLTAWPATAELSKPELGYTKRPIRVTPIDNFSLQPMQQAAADPGSYDTALIFSTKWEPPAGSLDLGRSNESTDIRYFDFHHDLHPVQAALLLHGRIVWQGSRGGEWAAVLRFPRSVDAELHPEPLR